jgi:hypothetical protein
MEGEILMRSKRPFSIFVRRVVLVCGLALLPLSWATSATNDVTGLIPALTTTFDGDSVVNLNGTGAYAMFYSEGTLKYVPAWNGRRIDTSSYTPYGNLSGVAPAGSSFTVSAFATLGPREPRTHVPSARRHRRDGRRLSCFAAEAAPRTPW